MTTLTPAMAVKQIENVSGYPATTILLLIKDSQGHIVTSQSTPSGPTAAFPQFQYSLPAGDYTAECKCVNSQGTVLGEVVSVPFTVQPMMAYVPATLSISVA